MLISVFLSAINHSNDQVDENESDRMRTKQISFVDQQLIRIIVIALPCGVGLIILFIIVVVVVRHLVDVVEYVVRKRKKRKRDKEYENRLDNLQGPTI